MNSGFNGTGIRAFCTDIDGTLLDNRRELSPATISAIGAIKDLMPVILASSRMPSAMRHLQQELGILQHPLICYNGGYVLKYHADIPTVLYSAVIDVSIVAEILNITATTSVHVSLYHEDQWYAPRYDEWTRREATITKVSPQIKAGPEVLIDWQHSGKGAHKVMIMGDASEISVIERTLRSRFRHDVHVYHSKSTYLEIAPKVISKASALGLLLNRWYNIALERVIAFGDNYNDIEMLQAVGLGIAVENARDEVKSVAKKITLDSKQNGVAEAIRKYILTGDRPA